MIVAKVFSGEGDTEIDYGFHSFVAAPRTGERVFVLFQERTKRLFVTEVMHYAEGSGSMRSAAHILLRTIPR